MLLLLSAACATHPTPSTTLEPSTLIVNQGKQQPFLNVSIAAFVNKSSDKGGLSRIYAPIREIEANYLPVLLRTTLNDSGNWGAVKVAPLPDPSSEVQVTASILESTALELRLHVHVEDSRKVIWVDKIYDARAQAGDYEDEKNIGDDVFQPLFNRIANDIYRARAGLSEHDGATILQASLLRYAIALSPETFSSYLIQDGKGAIKVAGLPAENDDMYLRVKKIRAVEYKFDDVMDEQFSSFFEKLRGVYPFWQRYSYELLAYNDHIKATGSTSDERAPAGSWAATEDVYRTYKEYKLNEDELRELAKSFKSETHRSVSELEGHEIELTGPLADQYRKWREILRKIYAEERQGTGKQAEVKSASGG